MINIISIITTTNIMLTIAVVSIVSVCLRLRHWSGHRLRKSVGSPDQDDVGRVWVLSWYYCGSFVFLKHLNPPLPPPIPAPVTGVPTVTSITVIPVVGLRLGWPEMIKIEILKLLIVFGWVHLKVVRFLNWPMTVGEPVNLTNLKATWRLLKYSGGWF